jgi:hypothetical protein
MKTESPILGSQIPELKNSPIAWEGDDDTEALRETLPSEPVCFFNDREFKHGAIVSGEGVRLRCERGVWVPAGPGDPENP